ncbi:MAG: Bacterial membrane protein YfhO [Microgenomates group bacterium ADurb.Bin238]|nr:MAG: Bacterial membrane protein YfhO [Microgenomates group bacterium ADurb.Bin238]
MVKTALRKWWVFGLFLVLLAVFFNKVWLKGLVPFPGDLLVGAYYPWLEYKWGYEVGVPIKNQLISDIFSQVYIWKDLALESFRNGHWPLWNPYVYSGYPLLASFSGGVLYPLNIFLLLGVNGWSMMVIMQVLGSLAGMYWFLRLRKLERISAVIGAVAYAFSAAMMIRLEWNTAGQVMWWLSVTMVLVEYYFEKSKRSAILIPAAIFMLVTAGHFQTMFYSLILLLSYTVFKWAGKQRKFGVTLIVAMGLGLLISSLQILPTMEMMGKSVRLAESAIVRDNYGLLPLGNLITMWAPDFFGNPTTINYWGVINYNETAFYPGLIGFVALLWALFNWMKIRRENRFFLMVALVAVLMAFDNPLGRLIYELKFPLLSTGYAARVLVILVFACSVLIGSWLEKLRDMNRKEMYLPLVLFGLMALVSIVVIFYAKRIFLTEAELVPEWILNMKVAIRNMIWPSLLTMALAGVVLFRKWVDIRWVILFIVVLDLFRFGWKYTPFVSREFVYPNTEVTEFLTNQEGLFRVETKKGPILPANTWAMYRLYSASGYDPLAPRDYTLEYGRQLNGVAVESRYALLDYYDPAKLGEFNVKYLLIDREHFTKGVGDWKTAHETEKMLILENPEFKNRVELLGEGGEVEVSSYTPNEIKIGYRAEENGEVVVRDAWDEGWKAYVNGEETRIDKYNEIFRKVGVKAGEGEIVMRYDPKEWKLAKQLAILGLAGWGVLSVNIMKGRRKNE